MVSSHWPGALPLGLGSTVAPSSTSACLRLLAGMGMRQVAARACESGDLVGVAAQGERERFGDGFAGEVVFGGAEAAHEDDNVGAAEGGADGVDQVFAAVADDGLEGDGDAELVELFGEVEGVGVLAEGGEHLGADGDDFGFHKAAIREQGSGISGSES